jgi:hypothetical protein
MADILELGAALDNRNEPSQLTELDTDLTSGDVIARVEEVVEAFVADLADGRVPALRLVSRAASNTAFFQHPNAPEAGISGQPAAVDAAPASQEVLGLGDQVTTRSLLANQGASAVAYARGARRLGGPRHAWGEVLDRLRH